MEGGVWYAYRAFHGFGAKGRTGGPEAISSAENQLSHSCDVFSIFYWYFLYVLRKAAIICEILQTKKHGLGLGLGLGLLEQPKRMIRRIHTYKMS